MNVKRPEHRREKITARLRPKAVATVARLQQQLRRHGERDSTGRALEYALEYAAWAASSGIDIVEQIKAKRGRIT